MFLSSKTTLFGPDMHCTGEHAVKGSNFQVTTIKDCMNFHSLSVEAFPNNCQKDLEENMTQSMKNLEAQNNLIESEESEDNEDFQDEDTRHSMKYKGSFAYDPQ